MTNPVVTLSPFAGAGAQFFDNNGVPLAGGLLYTYSAGTTTPQATYTTPVGNVSNSNPIVLDSSGRTAQEIWLLNGYSYKFVLQSATATQIGSYDNIPGQSSNVAIINDANSVAYEQGTSVTAGSFIVGQTYLITSVGTTNFQTIGASSNTVGIYFTATGVGSGTGTAQTSRTVQSKLQETVSVKDFGAFCNGSTDDSAAFQAALNYSSSNNVILTWSGNMAIKSTVTSPGTVNIVGKGINGTTLTFYNGACLKTIVETEEGTLQSLTIQDANDQSTVQSNPLIYLAGSFGYFISQVFINGQNKRRYGMWIGKGYTGYLATCWGSSFIRNRFYQCQVGIVVGDTDDATHNLFSANTCDHNSVAGAVFCNPTGGSIIGNSFEQNSGYTGLAILSQANGGTTPGGPLFVSGNYVYNNGTTGYNVHNNGITVGVTVYGSDFDTAGTYQLTSGSYVQQIDIKNNYVVSNYYNRAFLLNLFRSNQIVDNTVVVSSSSSYEIELQGTTTSGSVIDGNWNQNTGNLARVTTTVANQLYLFPVYSNSAGLIEPVSNTIILGNTTSGFTNKSEFRSKGVTGTGGTWTNIFDTTNEFLAISGTNTGVAQLLIAVQQTNEANQSVNVIYISSGLAGGTPGTLSVGANYSIAYSNPASLPDNRAFQLVNNVLQLKSDNSWYAVITVVATGNAF
jgi:hypothetical protein